MNKKIRRNPGKGNVVVNLNRLTITEDDIIDAMKACGEKPEIVAAFEKAKGTGRLPDLSPTSPL